MITIAPRLTREDQLLGAFEIAGARGLVKEEMAVAAGKDWRRVLRSLEAQGHIFNVRRSRFTGQPWRWVYIGLPIATSLAPEREQTVPPQLALPVLKPGGDR